MSGINFLKPKVTEIIQSVRAQWCQDMSSVKGKLEDLNFIIHCLNTNGIKINPKNNVTSSGSAKNSEDSNKSPKNSVQANENVNGEENDDSETFRKPSISQKKKKRGRPKKTTSTDQESKARSESTCDTSLDDSTSSTSSSRSSRSRRAAAQAADKKMVQVQSLIKAKKLRRPTDFDEKHTKTTNIVSSPPAKCRKTDRKQSAGSGSTEEGDQLEIEVKNSENTLENVEVAVDNKDVDKICKVVVERLLSPQIKMLTRSRSLEMSFSKRTSEDLFNENIPLSDCVNKENDPSQEAVPKKKSINTVSKDNLNTTHTMVNSEVTPKNLKSKKNEGNSLDEEVHLMIDGHLPVAHSSPVVCLSPLSEGEFRGFNVPSDKNDVIENNTMHYNLNSGENEKHHAKKGNLPTTHGVPENEFNLQQVKNEVIENSPNVIRQNTFTKEHIDKALKVVEIKNEETQHYVMRKTVTLDDQEKDEVVEIETNTQRSRTKVLRKRGNQTEEKINDIPSEIDSGGEKKEDSQNIRSRTKVIKKANKKNHEVDQKASIEELTNGNHLSAEEDLQSESNIRSRTKVLRKKIDSSSEEERSIRTRTKTMKKVPSPDDINLQLLSPQFKEPLVVLNKGLTLLSPKSPATTRGELVKKRVEDFEKITNGIKDIEEEKTGRVTRNATRNKAITSSQESLNSKQTRVPAISVKNIMTNGKGKHNKRKEDKENIINNVVGSAKRVPSAERCRGTPLVVNNIRVTPATAPNSKTQDVNKFGNSATRQVPVENNTALIQKQAAEDADKKKKEEERKKRQAKEDEAKKKKEKTLKATAEEARRKREEKLQKVAAAREAAEKEKALLAAKAEKEKEEKMRQMAVEKEKQKEEQMKKKLLTQQKTLEHEERRKLEEAARLAKLKEQEEEHKRIIAMKEREQELQKQRAAELRLAEAEKMKHQGGKLGKIAAVNNAKMKLQQGTTPLPKATEASGIQSYEITPAREDRPLLKPKTDDDYGIDDANSGDSSDEESHPKKMIPLWAQPKNRERMLVVNSFLPNEIWNLFMESDPNPDVNRIFAGNPIKKRLRTSSAVWKTPPRCTHFLHK